MKHIKNNLIPVSVFVPAAVSFRLAGVDDRYPAAEIYIRFAGNTFFILILILLITCGTGISFAIVVGAISAQMVMVFSVGLKLEGAMASMFVTGASIVLPILFGMMAAALSNRTKGCGMIVSIMIGQLSSVIYQFIFMVAYGLLIQPRDRDILLDRGIGVRSMVDARNISSVFRGILPFRFNGKAYSLFPLAIILFFSLVFLYIQKTRLGALAKATETNGGTAGTLGIVGNRVHSICTVISTILAAISQILLVADFGIINVYTGRLSLGTFAVAVISASGISIKKAKMGNCLIGAILFHALFITSPIVGQSLFHNPSVGEYSRSFLAYGVVVTAIIMSLRSGRAKVQSI